MKKEFDEHVGDCRFDRVAVFDSLKKTALYGSQNDKWAYTEWPQLNTL